MPAGRHSTRLRTQALTFLAFPAARIGRLYLLKTKSLYFFLDLFGCFGVKSCQKSANNNGIGGAIRESARPGNRFPDRALLLSLYWSGQRAGDGCRGGCGGPWSSRKAVQTFQIPAGGAEAQPWVTVHIWVTAPRPCQQNR